MKVTTHKPSCKDGVDYILLMLWYDRNWICVAATAHQYKQRSRRMDCQLVVGIKTAIKCISQLSLVFIMSIGICTALKLVRMN